VREREDANRTREAGHLDEIQGVVANTMDSFRNGAVGFIDWLGLRLESEKKLRINLSEVGITELWCCCLADANVAKASIHWLN
jgi:hypothetical protein